MDMGKKISGASLGLKGVLMALCSCALWGSGVPFLKATYQCFQISSNDIGSQFLLAGIRFGLSGVLIIFFLGSKEKAVPRIIKGEWKVILHVAIYQTVFQYMFYYIGVANTSGVVVSIIVGSSAFFSFFLSCFFYRQEQFTWGKLLGCMVGFLGIVLCVGNGSLSGIEIKIMGAGSSILASVFYALSSCLLKKYAGKIDSVKLCGYQFFFGGIMLIIISMVVGGTISQVTITGILCVLYLAMVSAVAYSMWSVLLSKYSVSQITVFTFSTPLFGSIFSCFYDPNELRNLSFVTVIALGLVIMGIIIINKQAKINS